MAAKRSTKNRQKRTVAKGTTKAPAKKTTKRSVLPPPAKATTKSAAKIVAAAASGSAAGYDRIRERSAATAAEKSRAGRDIAGEMPAVVNPERKAQGKASYEYFCRIYFPQKFYLPWSNDHRRCIKVTEEVVWTGGLFAFAFPRGSGKTSNVEAATIYATLYGFRRFVVPIGSDERSALEILEAVKSELENNPRLAEDFPEVCYPIKCLEGIAQRGNGQLFNGARTCITWTSNEIVLPTIPGSAASGAVIRAAGITGRIRGMKFTRPDGASVRPDLVIPDDPQTDESARSPMQCSVRERIIGGAILGLAGPGKKIAALMPCTVIAPGDLADRYLNRDKHPEWQGQRAKLLYGLPKNAALWEQYAKIRADSLRAGNQGKEGTEFYRANREQMDEGALAGWPVRFNADEISAVQHAMNLKLSDERAFFAEYQNEPLTEDEQASEYLTAEEIAAKTNGRPRGEVPREATKLVAFIDVQKMLLFYVVAAFEDDFTGYVIDYGAFPGQRRDYFVASDARPTLAGMLEVDSTEAAIYQGLSRLTGDLLGKEWARDDEGKTVCHIDRCLVDANWGESTDVVYQFCRESTHAALLVPTHGYAIGASSRAMREYKAKPGDEVGDHWRRPLPANKRSVRYGLYDANHWKSFMHERLAVPMGGRGCLSLFGSDPAVHRLFGDHLDAEIGVKVTAKGRTLTEWKMRPQRRDNHLLDCTVGCCVAASMLRISLKERQQDRPRDKKRIKLSELQKQKQDGAGGGTYKQGR